MKKLNYILIVLVLCLAFCSCDDATDEPKDIQTEKLNFSEFLDAQNFVPGISQGDFKEQMKKYTYKGESISSGNGMFYDGQNGGGYTELGEGWTFNNDFYTSDDQKSTRYSNMLSTRVELDGLDLPYGITFEDTLKDVFEKMEFEEKPCDNFVPDKNSDTNMTLYNEDGNTLVYKELNRTTAPVEYEMPYVLEYTEVNDAGSDSEYIRTVTRKVIMSFAYNDNNNLLEFEMSVCQESELTANFDIISIEYKSVNYNGGTETYKLLDFSNCAVYKKHIVPEKYVIEDYNLLFNFEEHQKGPLIYKLYLSGLFSLDEEYKTNDNVMDGGEWSLTIKYADGTEKVSKGINNWPQHKFEKADIAFFDVIGKEFFGCVPTSYKTPPALQVTVSYKVDNHYYNDGIAGISPYKYEWRSARHEAEDYKPTTITFNPKAECNVTISVLKTNEPIVPIKDVTIYSYTDDVNNKTEFSFDFDGKNITAKFEDDKNYIVILKYRYGEAEYIFTTMD